MIKLSPILPAAARAATFRVRNFRRRLIHQRWQQLLAQLGFLSEHPSSCPQCLRATLQQFIDSHLEARCSFAFESSGSGSASVPVQQLRQLRYRQDHYRYEPRLLSACVIAALAMRTEPCRWPQSGAFPLFSSVLPFFLPQNVTSSDAKRLLNGEENLHSTLTH